MRIFVSFVFAGVSAPSTPMEAGASGVGSVSAIGSEGAEPTLSAASAVTDDLDVFALTEAQMQIDPLWLSFKSAQAEACFTADRLEESNSKTLSGVGVTLALTLVAAILLIPSAETLSRRHLLAGVGLTAALLSLVAGRIALIKRIMQKLYDPEAGLTLPALRGWMLVSMASAFAGVVTFLTWASLLRCIHLGAVAVCLFTLTLSVMGSLFVPSFRAGAVWVASAWAVLSLLHAAELLWLAPFKLSGLVSAIGMPVVLGFVLAWALELCWQHEKEVRLTLLPHPLPAFLYRGDD